MAVDRHRSTPNTSANTSARAVCTGLTANATGAARATGAAEDGRGATGTARHRRLRTRRSFIEPGRQNRAITIESAPRSSKK